MLKNVTVRPRSVFPDMSAEQLDNIKSYIQSSVDNFCRCNRKEKFSVRILFGGENRDWNGTPLQAAFNYFQNMGFNHNESKKRAAVNVGYLLKFVLADDQKQTYERVGKDSGALYRAA